MNRPIDPLGKRALFESPPSAPNDVIAAGARADGKQALFSAGTARPGTVLITCSSCDARSRVNLLDLGLRLVTGSAWLPARRFNRWMRCPACQRRTWCRIDWRQ